MIEKKNTYLAAKNNLDQIIEQVRAKDLPLEKALDLYEEAIRIGNSCADLIDKADFSMAEIEAFNASKDGELADDGAEDSDDGSNDREQPEDAEGERETTAQVEQTEHAD